MSVLAPYINRIDQYQYISFDMFDTLVKRDCSRPVEVFSYIEDEINRKLNRKTSFCSARIEAEKMARRKSHSEEVTLDEIYHYLNLGIADESLQDVKELEKKYEYALCQ